MQLAVCLPQVADLDGGGVFGTAEWVVDAHPLIRSDGPRWPLFVVSLRIGLSQLLVAPASTALGLWGPARLLRGSAAAAEPDHEGGRQTPRMA